MPVETSQKLIGRLMLGFVLAGMVTSGLFWTMQRLIAAPDGTLDATQRVYSVDFVKVAPKKHQQRPRVKPERPPPPITPPPKPSPLKLTPIVQDAQNRLIAAINVAPDINLSPQGFSLGISEGEYLPLVKVSPAYPPRALARGIEGWVMLEYTITEQGTVKDIRVVDSKPNNKIFHHSALEAAARWKYKPRIIAGKPVVVHGVKHKVTFRITK